MTFEFGNGGVEISVTDCVEKMSEEFPIELCKDDDVATAVTMPIFLHRDL